MSKPKILVCVLTGTERQNWINPELSSNLIQMSHDSRFEVAIANVKDARPFEVARNHTIKLARDNRFDWLVSLDNDNFMSSDTPLDIIATASREHAVIGLAYGIIPNGGTFGLYPVPGPAGNSAFEEVSAVGGGVLIVNRRVWESIPTGPWFRWHPGQETETLDRGTGGCGGGC